MFKLDLEKAEEPEIKLPTSTGSSKKQENSKKTSSALLTMPKTLTVWITTNCGQFFKRFFLRYLYAGQEEIVRIGHGTLDCSKLGKEYVKAVYCHPAYLTYMQSTSLPRPAQARVAPAQGENGASPLRKIRETKDGVERIRPKWLMPSFIVLQYI